ncbi:hypothetical protein ACN42_g370 [Penicillium freii]|uniref:Zn(2)-C6 fungal-type domain-containing protein n=1 Tax=Penicillium freii TaxID=48697 RepID=A0A124GTG3_PENFR|nr:hypothetical protein ACN42_g370 [Penicillium freii]
MTTLGSSTRCLVQRSNTEPNVTSSPSTNYYFQRPIDLLKQQKQRLGQGYIYHTMPRVTKPPVKAACLACRTSKTRCDGQHPCGNCSGKKRECSYQPSRRGGPRRGAQYERQRQPTAGNSLPSSMSDGANEIEPFLDNMIGLVSPYAGVHNLDLSPDSLSIVDGAQQVWGQLTPHDDSSFDSVPMHDRGSSTVRAYQSEVEMLVQKRHYSRHDRRLISDTQYQCLLYLYPSIFTFAAASSGTAARRSPYRDQAI